MMFFLFFLYICQWWTGKALRDVAVFVLRGMLGPPAEAEIYCMCVCQIVCVDEVFHRAFFWVVFGTWPLQVM